MTEWVQPGRAPAARCDWHTEDGVRLPTEYAEWADGRLEQHTVAAPARAAAARPTRLRIVSPLDGDRYRIPPGVPARYATLPLRAAAAGSVRWFVDSREVKGGRWGLVPGAHVVRAETGTGERMEVRIDVSP
jgi:hypothetical protein